MWSPPRVRIFFAAVMIPPALTQSLSLRSASSASGQSTRWRSASRTCLSGCAEMNRPIASFSIASSSGCSNSSVGIGGCCGAAKAAAAPLESSPAAAPVEAVEDRALADLEVLLDLLAGALGLLEHAEHAHRASRRSSRTRRT